MSNSQMEHALRIAMPYAAAQKSGSEVCVCLLLQRLIALLCASQSISSPAPASIHFLIFPVQDHFVPH